MPVRLRLAIHGKRNTRIFHLVAIHASKARNAQPIETLGVFSPRPDPETREKRVEWSVERIRYWLGVGAQPSDRVLRLLELGGILPRAPKPWDPTSSFAPTPAYPNPTPAHLSLTAPSPSGSPTSESTTFSAPDQIRRKPKPSRTTQLSLTRQHTHSPLALRTQPAPGGVPLDLPKSDRQKARIWEEREQKQLEREKEEDRLIVEILEREGVDLGNRRPEGSDNA